jgi:hypothetical protein
MRARIQAAGVVFLASVLAFTARGQEVRFVAATPALENAVRTYQAIWDEHGKDIVAALESRTCLQFPESSVRAIVADATSNSGGPEYPMRLRASYPPEAKQSTLVHELGHRHLWQLEERLDDVDGHMTLYLVLDLVWQDVWGEEFVEIRVRGESGWRSNYDYGEAWSWARSLDAEERARLWGELLSLNGFFYGCNNLTGLEE